MVDENKIMLVIGLILVVGGVVVFAGGTATKSLNICNRAGYNEVQGVDFMVNKCINKSISNNGLYVYDYENAITIRLKDYNYDGTRR